MRQKGWLLQSGDFFEGYRVVRPLGRGGIGEVYEVAHQGQRFALKVVKAAWLDEERTLAEGRILELVNHPNVVRVHESGMTRDRVMWIRMELLRGRTLRDLMNRRGRASARLVCSYLRSVSLGAHQCHLVGVIHRDIKPENVFVTGDEHVKLLDFGVAKLYGGPDTRDGHRKGTPAYMAPEQIRGQRVTPAVDVYAIGLMAFEMLAGAHPFVRDFSAYDVREVFERQLFDDPPPLAELRVPGPLSDVIARALEKDPARRPQNGLELAEDLWGAWEVIRERGTAPRTYPGEPEAEDLPALLGGALRFGTGPEGVRRGDRAASAPSPGLGSGSGRGGAAASREARTLPFQRQRDRWAAPRASAAIGPSVTTVELPESERDPSCVLARVLGSGWDGEEAASPGFEGSDEEVAEPVRSETRLVGVGRAIARREGTSLPANCEAWDGGASLGWARGRSLARAVRQGGLLAAAALAGYVARGAVGAAPASAWVGSPPFVAVMGEPSGVGRARSALADLTAPAALPASAELPASAKLPISTALPASAALPTSTALPAPASSSPLSPTAGATPGATPQTPKPPPKPPPKPRPKRTRLLD